MGDLDPNEDYNLNAVDGSQINLRDLFDVIATGRLSVLGLASAISTVVNTAISGIASGGSGLLASMSYSGSAASTSSTTAVDLDATNLKITFTVPASGTVLVKLSGPIYNDAALPTQGETMFTVTDQPTSATAPDHGPFITDKLFPTEEGKALTSTYPDTEEGQAAVKLVTKQARAAASHLGLTARVKVEGVKDGKSKALKVTIWTRTKITRPRNGSDEAIQSDPHRLTPEANEPAK